jgi:hypothetical protein
MNRRLLDRWNNKARASAFAAQKRAAHFEQRDKEAKLVPKKPKFVAEVPLANRLDGSPEAGQVVGTAKIEQLPGGDCVIHIDAEGMTAEMLRRGFSVGEFSIPDEEIVNISLQKEPRNEEPT